MITRPAFLSDTNIVAARYFVSVLSKIEFERTIKRSLWWPSIFLLIIIMPVWEEVNRWFHS